MYDLDSMRASARHVSSVFDASLPSEHSVVELVLPLLAQGTRRTILRRIIHHPMFGAFFDEVIPELEVDTQAPFDSISRLAEVFHDIAQQVRRESRPTSTCRAHVWLAHWMLAAHMAYRRGDEGRVRGALARIGGARITSMFLHAAGNLHESIDEGAFAREVG